MTTAWLNTPPMTRGIKYILHKNNMGLIARKTDCIAENNKGEDQPAYLCGLISAFVIPTLESTLA